MNTNNERIFKYLSDLMTENERNSFENELINDVKLSQEFLFYSEKLDNMKLDNVELESSYFNNLLPKVRNSLDKPVKNKTLTRLAFGLPTMAVVLFAGIIFIKSGVTTNNGTDIINEIVNNMDNEIVSSKYISDLDIDLQNIYNSENEHNANLDNGYDEATKRKLLTIYDYPVNEEILSASQLSKEELHSIYLKIAPPNY